MAIRLINIGQQHGYTSTDHLLDDTALQALIGRKFPSLAAIRRTAAFRHADAPVWVEYHVDGKTRQITM